MTSRTLASPDPGPITLRADAGACDIRVQVTDAEYASVTIRTEASTGPAHDAVTNATLLHDAAGASLTATVHGAGGQMTSRINGSVAIGGNVVCAGSGSSVVQVNGRTWINGVEITAGPGAAGSVRIEAVLPLGSSVELRTATGDITAAGPLETAHARTGTGRIEIEQARTVDLEADTGKVTVGRAESAQIATGAGGIRVGVAGTLTASSDVGSIRVQEVRGPARLAASCGDIKAGYSGPKPHATTSVGSVKLRRIEALINDALPTATPGPPGAAPPGAGESGPRDAAPRAGAHGEPEDAVPPGYKRPGPKTPWWRR